MMKPRPGYLGVAFSVTRARNGEWRWEFYPNKEEAPVQRGLAGSCKDAEAACKNAIDAWLRQRSHPSPSAAGR